jgi:uncharacterized coiled-coil protein SlyX
MAVATSIAEPGSDGLIPEHLRCTRGAYCTLHYYDIMDLMPDFTRSGLNVKIALALRFNEWPISPDSSILSPEFWIEPLLRHERPATMTTLRCILLHRIMTHSLTGFPKQMALWYKMAGLDLLECMRPLSGKDEEMNYRDTPISHSVVAKRLTAVPKVPTAVPKAPAAAPKATPTPAAGGGTKRPGSKLQQPASRSKRSKTQEDAPTLEALWDVVKNQQTIVKDLQTTVTYLQNTVKDQQTTVKNQQAIVKDLQTTVKNQQTTVKDLQTTVKNQQTIVGNQQKVITKLEQRVSRIITGNTKHAAIMAEAAKVHQEIKEE